MIVKAVGFLSCVWLWYYKDGRDDVICDTIWERDLFDKNIILRNKQLKMAYICVTMGNRMLVIFTALLSLFFYLAVRCDKFLLGHHLELS